MSPIPNPGLAPVRLRQIALITNDLARARHQLTSILDTEVIFEDPAVAQWGLVNILVPLHGNIIEVCAPMTPGRGTTVGRLLEKRGDGGYMLIMQTLDAGARRRYIEGNQLAGVIFGYEHVDEGVVCVQYHPRGVRGGMMPELDSHSVTRENPTPLATERSEWHACGKEYARYAAGMGRATHLRLVGVTLRVAAGGGSGGGGGSQVRDAVRQWSGLFGIQGDEARGELAFTNAGLRFVEAKDGEQEGLESITVEITGRERFERTLATARREGLGGDGFVSLLGVKWFFVLKEEKDNGPKSRL